VKTVAIFDVETTGLSPPEARIIELGCVLWSVEERGILSCYTALLSSPDNPAEQWNGISPALLRKAADREIAWAIVDDLANCADAVVAHSAVFDRKFVQAERSHTPLLDLSWICTLEDVHWPKLEHGGNPGSGSLVRTALAHGVAIVSAHRSIHDCLLLARLFEAVDDIDERLEVGLERARRPKDTFIAQTEYEQKDLVKAHGFHYNGEFWSRYMACEDAAKLPFTVVAMGG
jgi:DNA polymerase-3 subunit epsilon